MKKQRLLELAGVQLTENTPKVWLEMYGAEESYGTIGPFQNLAHAQRWAEQITQKNPDIHWKEAFVLSPDEFTTTLEDRQSSGLA